MECATSDWEGRAWPLAQSVPRAIGSQGAAVFWTARMPERISDGLVIGSDPFFNSQSEQIAALAIRHAVPAIYQYRKFAAAGGLTSYGGRLADSYRQVGIYTGRILKGEKPERAGRLLQPRHRRHHGFRADSDERQRFRTLCRYDEPRPLAQANTSPRSKGSRA